MDQVLANDQAENCGDLFIAMDVHAVLKEIS